MLNSHNIFLSNYVSHRNGKSKFTVLWWIHLNIVYQISKKFLDYDRQHDAEEVPCIQVKKKIMQFWIKNNEIKKSNLVKNDKKNRHFINS